MNGRTSAQKVNRTMFFQQFLNRRHGCASYLVASGESAEAVVIDPAMEIEQYDAALDERGYTLRYVIDTHIHADHISGARALAARHEAALLLHESAQTAYPFQPLRDNEQLELGELRLCVWHSPGHRPELVTLGVINPPQGQEPVLALTADTLLVGSVGRPDFNGGDAEAQYDTLERLLQLPDYAPIFPGHFEGVCGAGMYGQSVTTVGIERRHNQFTKLDRKAFVAALTRSAPARPLNMTAIEATNRGLAEMSWAMVPASAPPREIEVDELRDTPPGSMTLDIREPVEYVRGHLPGALNLPQADLASKLEELPRERALMVICAHGNRSLLAAQFLEQMGFQHVASVRGGTEAWRAAGYPLVYGLAPME
jgi:glyoxylase-like metal-dependent hydrolase (beta-lactamase superfamily II)/rhodanese-related sulfurtransferase